MLRVKDEGRLLLVGRRSGATSSPAAYYFTTRREQDIELKMAFIYVPHRFSRTTCKSADSDVGHRAEELVILRISTFTFVDGLDVFYKLNGLYPLHHFEPEFVFRTQPQRCAMRNCEGLEIHLIRKQGLWMPEVLDDVTVIVLSSLAAFAERVEDRHLGLRLGPDQIHQFNHLQPAPRSYARPPLNAIMQRDLGLFTHGVHVFQRQLHRILHQAMHLQPISCEAAHYQCLPFIGNRPFAVD